MTHFGHSDTCWCLAFRWRHSGYSLRLHVPREVGAEIERALTGPRSLLYFMKVVSGFFAVAVDCNFSKDHRNSIVSVERWPFPLMSHWKYNRHYWCLSEKYWKKESGITNGNCSEEYWRVSLGLAVSADLKHLLTKTEMAGNTEIHAVFPLIFSVKGIRLVIQMWWEAALWYLWGEWSRVWEVRWALEMKPQASVLSVSVRGFFDVDDDFFAAKTNCFSPQSNYLLIRWGSLAADSQFYRKFLLLLSY